MNTTFQNGTNSAPLVFCHFGNSPYLPYVFACARLSNPSKRIVLLGDESNRRTAERHGLVHHPYKDFAKGSEIETFERVFCRVIGPKRSYLRGDIDWIKFVFQRWFYVYNYLRSENIRSFWHFDTDNMLLDDLARHEPRLMDYDCTEQCNGKCLNGFISNLDVVSNYLAKINDIFQRIQFLREIQHNFNISNPTFAFTEMDAYSIFKEEEHPRSIHLAAPHNGTMFDDAICQTHGMEMERLYYGKHIKKVFLADKGQFFCKNKSTQELVRMASLNLSWVPILIFDNVLRHRKRRISNEPFIASNDCAIGQTLASCFPSCNYLLNEGPREVWRYGLKILLRPTLNRIERNQKRINKQPDGKNPI
jgi:hypothetical protein